MGQFVVSIDTFETLFLCAWLNAARASAPPQQRDDLKLANQP